MANFFYAPPPLQDTFFIPGGNTPGNGVQLFLYVAGTNTKQTAYKDNLGSSSWTNPIVLDSGGNLPSGGVIWFPSGQTFKAVYAPSNDTDPPGSPYRTIDNLSGINDTASATASEWINGSPPTFISATSFSLAGDQTSAFHKGRRLMSTNSGGTIYSTIVNSVFSVSLTTVTVANDSSALDAGMAGVSYSINSANNPSNSPEMVHKKGASVVSAATTNIWNTVGDYIHVTSTNQIQGFSTAPYAGASKILLFDSALSLANNAFIQTGTGATLNVAASSAAFVRADTTTLAVIVNNPATFVNTVLRNYIAGFTMANIGATSSMTVSTGLAADSGNADYLNLPSPLNKTMTSWAVGSSTGGLLDSGTVSSSAWYHFFSIKRTDTGVVDVGFSSSFANPVMPTNYTLKRRIGSALNTSGAWAPFNQSGDMFRWNTPILDVNNQAASSTYTAFTVSAPLGIRTTGFGNLTTASNANIAHVRAKNATLGGLDGVPSLTASPLSEAGINAAGLSGGHWQEFVDSVSQIEVAATANTNVYLTTTGYWDSRGKDN